MPTTGVGLARTQVRLLVRLKALLLLRGYTRDRTRLAGLILVLLTLGPLSAMGAVGMWFLTKTATADTTQSVLLVAGAAVWVGWIVAPLFGYQFSEVYDLSRLLPFPIRPTTLFAGVMLGGLLDPGTLLLLPAMLATAVGMCRHWYDLPFTLAAVVFYILQTIGMAQAVGLGLSGIFATRRLRDAGMVLVPLFGVMIWLLQQLILGGLLANGAVRIRAELGGVLSFLPSGMAVRAMVATREGDYLAAIIFLLLLLGVALLTARLAGAFVGKLFRGELERGTMPAARQRTVRTRAAPAAGGLLAALVRKELAICWREPMLKQQFGSMISTVVIAFLATSRSRHPQIVPFVVLGMLTMSQLHGVQSAGGRRSRNLAAALLARTAPADPLREEPGPAAGAGGGAGGRLRGVRGDRPSDARAPRRADLDTARPLGDPRRR
jgi:hypothetical protein